MHLSEFAREAYLSAQQSGSQAPSRVSRQDSDTRRPTRVGGTSREGTQAAVRLILRKHSARFSGPSPRDAKAPPRLSSGREYWPAVRWGELGRASCTAPRGGARGRE